MSDRMSNRMSDIADYYTGVQHSQGGGLRPVNHEFTHHRPAPQPPHAPQSSPQPRAGNLRQQQHQHQDQPYWPSGQEAESVRTRSSDGAAALMTHKRPFKSYRLRGAYEKPWLGDKDMHKTKRNDIIIIVFIAIGFALAAAVIVLMVLPYRAGDVSTSKSSGRPESVRPY